MSILIRKFVALMRKKSISIQAKCFGTAEVVEVVAHWKIGSEVLGSTNLHHLAGQF